MSEIQVSVKPLNTRVNGNKVCIYTVWQDRLREQTVVKIGR